jgi:hypothetical protein
MVATESAGPYVSQPYGSITHPDKAAAGRLWGVAGVNFHADIRGLTKEEAEAVRDVLIAMLGTDKGE